MASWRWLPAIPRMVPPAPFLLFCAIATPLLSFSHALDISFSQFSNNDPSFNFSQSSTVEFMALQVTDNVPNRNITDTSGQITYIEPLRLWHDSYNYSASFNTSFVINISPLFLDEAHNVDNSSGGGMAFIISSKPAYEFLPDSFGAWLGLFNSSSSSQRAETVAIEFDTFKDSFDPDSNHVGVDVNDSVKSVVVESLGPQVFLTNTSRNSGMNTSVWIDYDGHAGILDVYVENGGGAAGGPKPDKAFIAGYEIDLRNYFPSSQFVYVGFSASLGSILETHCVLRWNFSSTEFPADGTLNNSRTSPILWGCVTGVLLLLIVMVFVTALFVLMRWRKRQLPPPEAIALASAHLGPRKFTYRELQRATHGFSKERNLGQGGSGAVFKGVLVSGNNITTEVAVKCLTLRSKQESKEFQAEVMSLGRMRHKNLVQLMGWSYERGKPMLVYEYMPHGSLDRWIKAGEKGKVEVMNWDTRFQVMKGLAAGLLYLHEECIDMVVIHRDLKPSNVLLDGDFNARIGDFGLAKLMGMDKECEHTMTISGTPGYIAPECVDQGIIGKESDIYSLGVIAFQLATGELPSMGALRSAVELLDKSRAAEAADPRLPPPADPAQVELLLRVGLACCHPLPSHRPSIRQVVHALRSLQTASPGPPSLTKAASITSLPSFSSSINITPADYIAIPLPPLLDISTSCPSAFELTDGR